MNIRGNAAQQTVANPAHAAGGGDGDGEQKLLRLVAGHRWFDPPQEYRSGASGLRAQFRGISPAIRMAEVEVVRYGDDLGPCSLLKNPGPRTMKTPGAR